jgi:hypothetical protein
MLHLLGRKQALADGIMDGMGDLAALKMPSGRAAFLERMQAMMAISTRRPSRIVPPEEALAADLIQRHGERVMLVEARQGSGGEMRLVAVLDLDQPAIAAECARLPAAGPVAVEMIDRATWVAMQRLAATGVLQFTYASRILHRSADLGEDDTEAPSARQRAVELATEADRALRMARVLAAGGFPEEAPALLAKAIHKAAAARMAERAELPNGAVSASDDEIKSLIEGGALPAAALTVLDATSSGASLPVADKVEALLAAAEHVLAAVAISDRMLAA